MLTVSGGRRKGDEGLTPFTRYRMGWWDREEERERGGDVHHCRGSYIHYHNIALLHIYTAPGPQPESKREVPRGIPNADLETGEEETIMRLRNHKV